MYYNYFYYYYYEKSVSVVTHLYISIDFAEIWPETFSGRGGIIDSRGGSKEIQTFDLHVGPYIIKLYKDHPNVQLYTFTCTLT